MTIKKFFEAMKAGSKIVFEKNWSLIRLTVAIAVPSIAVAVIANKLNVEGPLYYFLCGITAILAWIILCIYLRCKDVVKYAEENNVSMREAWIATTPVVYFDDDF